MYLHEILSDVRFHLVVAIFCTGAAVAFGITAVAVFFDERQRRKGTMSNLQLIEALCGVVEQLVAVVKQLAGKLEQINALNEADRQAVNDALELYTVTLGADEAPDYYYQEE